MSTKIDIEQVDGIGALATLTTTDKSNLVNAINEVKGSVPSVTGFVPYTGANQAVNLGTQLLKQRSFTQFSLFSQDFVPGTNNGILGYWRLNLGTSISYGSFFDIKFSGGYNTYNSSGLIGVRGHIRAQSFMEVYSVRGNVTNDLYLEPEVFQDSNGVYFLKIWKKKTGNIHILLSGMIQVSIDDISFELVDDSTPVTGVNRNYLLDYNNFINTPTIPTVNNGQLTLSTGTGLSGSANFTANQSGNSSFSVSVASTHKLPTTAEWNALPTTNTTYTAGTGLSLTGTVFGQTIITSGTGTFVTGITQTTNGFQVNLGTPPNTTYTAGNGLTLSGTTFSLPITYSGTGDYIANIVQNTNGLTVTRATLPTFTDAITSVSRNGVNIPIVSQNVDIPIFSTSGAGLVPARVGSVATKYLREDGTWVTPTNTTYTAGTLAILNTGTSATNQLWSSLILNQWLNGKGYLTEVTEASNASVGGMKLASDIPGGTPNSVSNVANRWYAVQMNDEGHGVVNVPWVEDNSVSNFITSDTDQSALTGNKITAGKWIFKGSSNHHIETLTDSSTVNSIASGLSFRWHDSDWRVGNMRGLSTDSLGLTINLNGAEKVRITASSDIVTTSFGAASNWIQAWQWGNHATAGYIKRNVSNVVDSYSFSLDGIGGALTMSPQGLTLIGSDSTNPDSENWDSNFEVSLEEKLFRMWSTDYGNGFSFSLNDKGYTNIKIPDSEAPYSQKVLPLKFTMNGAAYEADANGLVALPNSVSNTTFTNNAQNSTTQNQTVTLTNTSYPRVERVFYGGTTNGTLTLNKYAPVDGDEIMIQGRQCTIVLKKSSTVNHPIFTADQQSAVYLVRLADVSIVGGEVRQFVHLRYMANYQAWVVLSASLR